MFVFPWMFLLVDVYYMTLRSSCFCSCIVKCSKILWFDILTPCEGQKYICSQVLSQRSMILNEINTEKAFLLYSTDVIFTHCKIVVVYHLPKQWRQDYKNTKSF
jgi:hypothetical protein